MTNDHAVTKSTQAVSKEIIRKGLDLDILPLCKQGLMTLSRPASTLLLCPLYPPQLNPHPLTHPSCQLPSLLVLPTPCLSQVLHTSATNQQCFLPLNPCTAEMRAAHLHLLGVALLAISSLPSLSTSSPDSPTSTATPESLKNASALSSETDVDQLERESRADLLSERQDGNLGIQFFGILSPERLRNAPRLQRFTELLRRPIRNLIPDSMRFQTPRMQQMNRQLNQIRSNIQQGALRGMGRLQAIQRMPQEGLRGNLPFQGEGTRAIRNLGQRLQGMRLPQIPSPPRLQGLRLQRPNLQGLRLQRPNLAGLGSSPANPLQSLAQRMRLPQNSPLLALRERLQGLRRNTSKRLQRLQTLPPYLEEYEDFEAA